MGCWWFTARLGLQINSMCTKHCRQTEYMMSPAHIAGFHTRMYVMPWWFIFTHSFQSKIITFVLVCFLKQEILNVQIHHLNVCIKVSSLWKQMLNSSSLSAAAPHTHALTHAAPRQEPHFFTSDTQLSVLPKCYTNTFFHSFSSPNLQGKLGLSLLPKEVSLTLQVSLQLA